MSFRINPTLCTLVKVPAEYVTSGNVRGYAGTLMYEYGAFQRTLSEMAEKSMIVSPTLLQLDVGLNIAVPSQFDIGMGEWMSPPCEKKSRILVDVTNSKRFAAPVTPTSMKLRESFRPTPRHPQCGLRIILKLGLRVDWILEASASSTGYFEVMMPISCVKGSAIS